ncbi:unnamed protein product [Prorocentrum cordatum]|uniref:Uncharacterized protein n=1 Tax=Prorocentrum cordatum TaxID=2364126 RepID=A0ABN9VLQ9_9DINO|nr:unnamed protein product [Polarella glacialis]
MAVSRTGLTGTRSFFPNHPDNFFNGAKFGKVARFLLSDFNTVEALKLANTDSDLKGFYGGFTDGTYGYVVLYHNGAAYSGKVARFLLSDFNTVEVLHLASADSDLEGFFGGFTDGTYGYAVPHNNGAALSGRVARFQLAPLLASLAPTPSAASAVGGPHLVNTYGERFENYQPGDHVLLQVPCVCLSLMA